LITRKNNATTAAKPSTSSSNNIPRISGSFDFFFGCVKGTPWAGALCGLGGSTVVGLSAGVSVTAGAPVASVFFGMVALGAAMVAFGSRGSPDLSRGG